MSKNVWLWFLVLFLAWANGALGQLELIQDLRAGPNLIAPGDSSVTQMVKVQDQDADLNAVKLTKVLVENVLGTAVASDFAQIDIWDLVGNLLGSVAYPFSFPVEIDIFDVVIQDDGEFSLQVQVTVAHGVIGHRTIQTRLTLVHEEGGAIYYRTVDDLTRTTINNYPVGENDQYEMDEDTSLVVPADEGVLANDYDVDGDQLIAEQPWGPWFGTLTLYDDGSFFYMPNKDFAGTDYFLYWVYDGFSYSSRPVRVTIVVRPTNDPPVAKDDEARTAEDTSCVIFVLENDEDIDGTLIPGSIMITLPQKGSATVNLNGTVTYTPHPNFVGIDTFEYRVRDNEGAWSNWATVTIYVLDVNDPPVAEDDEYEVDEDGILEVNFPGVLKNDSDVDGDSLTAVLVSGPSNGTLTLNLNGSFTYKPNTNFAGEDSFTYKAYDGQAYSNEATVTITVHPVNDPPVAQNDSATTQEEQPVVINVLRNDEDVDGELDPSTVFITEAPSNGTAEVLQDGTIRYTPKPDFFGTDSFKYKVKDSKGAESNEATVTVTVSMVPYSAQLTLSVGWNMISIPLKPIPPNNTPAAVFGDDIEPPLLIYRWNPDAGQYEIPTVVDPGHGYWVYIMTEGITVDVENAQRIDGDYEVPLGKKGWHMISTPTVNVYWGYCKFRLGNEVRTYEQALNPKDPWISPYLFRWNPIQNKYERFKATGVIEPWAGYWIRTYKDGLVLILPVYDAIRNPPAPPTESALEPTVAEPELMPPMPPTLPLTDKATGFSVFNYPNPIRDVHTTKFVVLGAGVEAIRVSVYDLTGRLVWRGETPGHELTWHTDDLTGRYLANGVYLYVVEVKVAGGWVRSEVKRLVILR